MSTAHEAAAPSTTTAERVLKITRTFAATPEQVFAAWTQPEHMNRWCAPEGFTIPHSEGEIRPGGRWRSCMRSPRGEEYWLGGVYLDLVPPALVQFTQAWDQDDGRPGPETTVTVRLRADSTGTRMDFEQGVFATQESCDSHRGGWTECFDILERYLATLSNR